MADPMLPNITVQQLEYLRAVSQAPTWTLAATQVGVTPSALSQGLAELERRVGLPLFEKRGRRRVLTANADEVLHHAEVVLGATIGLGRWIEERRRGVAGPVRIGMIDSALTDHCRVPLQSFVAERPDVDLRLRVAPSAALLDGLVQASLDLVICVTPAEIPVGVTAAPFLREMMSIVSPVDPRQIPPAEWGPWVGFPPGSHSRAVVEAALRERGADLRTVAESHQPDILLEMIRLGIGWSVLPETAIRDAADLHLSPLLPRDLVMCTRTDARATPVHDALRARLMDR